MSEFDGYHQHTAAEEERAVFNKHVQQAKYDAVAAKATAEHKRQMAALKEEQARKVKLEALKLEEEITQWIEDQPRVLLEKLIREDNATWYVGNGKPNMDIATHISEYLEFLDRCDEEKQAQEDQRATNPTWGIFG